MTFQPGHACWNTGRIKSIHDRFWPKVDKRSASECWLWEGAIAGGTGYGIVSHGLRRTGAHRVSWEIHFGTIPARMFVCHHCDNRPCVNPAHLFLGTSRDNMLDARSKGRTLHQTHPERLARGERVATAKLTASTVILLRQLHAGGRSMKSLAKEYGLNFSSIRNVVLRLSWRHVP